MVLASVNGKSEMKIKPLKKQVSLEIDVDLQKFHLQAGTCFRSRSGFPRGNHNNLYLLKRPFVLYTIGLQTFACFEIVKYLLPAIPHPWRGKQTDLKPCSSNFTK